MNVGSEPIPPVSLGTLNKGTRRDTPSGVTIWRHRRKWPFTNRKGRPQEEANQGTSEDPRLSALEPREDKFPVPRPHLDPTQPVALCRGSLEGPMGTG